MIRSMGTGPPERTRTSDADPKAQEQQVASTLTTTPGLLLVPRLANYHPAQAFNLPFGYLAMANNARRTAFPGLATHSLDQDFIATSQLVQE